MTDFHDATTPVEVKAPTREDAADALLARIQAFVREYVPGARTVRLEVLGYAGERQLVLVLTAADIRA